MYPSFLIIQSLPCDTMVALNYVCKMSYAEEEIVNVERVYPVGDQAGASTLATGSENCSVGNQANSSDNATGRGVCLEGNKAVSPINFAGRNSVEGGTPESRIGMEGESSGFMEYNLENQDSCYSPFQPRKSLLRSPLRRSISLGESFSPLEEFSTISKSSPLIDKREAKKRKAEKQSPES